MLSAPSAPLRPRQIMTVSHRCPTLSHLLTKLETRARPSSGKTPRSDIRHPVAAPHHPVTAQFWEAVWSAGEIVAIVTPGAADWPAPGPVTQRDVSRVTCDVSIRWPPLPGAAPRNLSECGDQWWPGPALS